MECPVVTGEFAKETAMNLITWIVAVPAVVLTVAYSVILAEVLAAKRRMRLLLSQLIGTLNAGSERPRARSKPHRANRFGE